MSLGLDLTDLDLMYSPILNEHFPSEIALKQLPVTYLRNPLAHGHQKHDRMTKLEEYPAANFKPACQIF
jgi:hypothetical protein